MDLTRFVRVFVPKTKSLGTGYLIERGRVLTAAHVVEDSDDAEVRRVETTSDVPAKVVWNGADLGLDAALLEINPVEDSAFESSRLAVDPLAETSPWESRGYAVAGGASESGLVGLSGKAYSWRRAETTFEVTVDAAPEIEDWCGISGASVFAGGRLLGVIAKAPRAYRCERIHCVAVPALLRQAGFRQHVTGGSLSARRESLLKEVGGLLEREIDAARALASRKPRTWGKAYADGGASGLAEEICDRSSVREVLEEINKAHRGVYDPGSAAAEALVTIVALVVPFLFGREVLGVALETRAVVLQLPLAIATPAEWVMADLDWRPFGFDPPTSEHEHPPAKNRVVWQRLETGIDPEKSWTFKDFVIHLANQFLATDVRNELLRNQNPEAVFLERATYLVNRRLARLAREVDHPARHYLVYHRQLGEKYSQFFLRVKKSLPELALVELTGGNLEVEDELCQLLAELLSRRSP